MHGPVFSNIGHLIQIAETAFDRSDRLLERSFPRMPGGRRIGAPDRRSRSFRHALVAIVFASIAMEAIVFAELRRTGSKTRAKRVSQMSYRTQLRAVGVTDEQLLLAAERLQDVRNEIVHEKLIVMGDRADLRRLRGRTAQDEARYAVACLFGLRQHLTIRADAG
ncbi:MAG: hypothetical protein HY369_03615 [Candidatus Aenigmarchaeota archaeon]|nr:hypothetical protein [Candidatus Aenigmarchaeota archaeon]